MVRLSRMTTMKVGPKGQVVLPKRVRDELGIRPGDEVTIHAGDGEARVRRVVDVDGLVGMLPDGASTHDLEVEHRRELEREEKRIADYVEGRWP